MKKPLLVMKGLSLKFGQVKVLDNLNLTLFEGQILGLLGGSGCGKTTLLRSISGFQPELQGKIYLNGEDLSRKAICERDLGFVFQDLSLFPHMTVEENINFGLHRVSLDFRQERVRELLKAFSLGQLGHRFPHELSGGQQQRVALARSMAPRPHLVLMDEPFSSLDGSLKVHLMRELRDIIKEQGQTVLFVTHSQEELFQFADQGECLWGGIFSKWGPWMRFITSLRLQR